jgi:hypothetical protein
VRARPADSKIASPGPDELAYRADQAATCAEVSWGAAQGEASKAPPLPSLFFLLPEYFGRSVALIGSGEAVAATVYERKREGHRSGGKVGCLDMQHLALLEFTNQFGRGLIVSPSVGKASREHGADHRLRIDDEAGAVLLLKRPRQGDAEQLSLLAFRLDQCRGHNRLTGLGTGAFAGEADLLGAWRIAFAAEFCPWRIDELRHLECE